MTYYVFMWMLNRTHSLAHNLFMIECDTYAFVFRSVTLASEEFMSQKLATRRKGAKCLDAHDS